MLSLVHAGPRLGLVLGITWLAFALWLAHRARIGVGVGTSAIGVGLAVGAGLLFTFMLSQQSFSPIAVKSISFTGPSADTLMGLIKSPSLRLGFDTSLVPGVVVGALFGALIAGEWKLHGFHDGPSMGRYVLGAMLMGFGGMLAGGCAVGAGVTGGAIFALTAWLALVAMWAGAMVTHYIVDVKIANTIASSEVPCLDVAGPATH